MLEARLAVAQNDVAVRRSGGAAQPLELEAGEDVRQPAEAVLGDPASVEEVVAGGHDDVALIDAWTSAQTLSKQSWVAM